MSSKLTIEKSTDTEVTFNTQRRLKNRHIQLIGIGGTIGTALFVTISSSLSKGGSLSLFLGFALWCIPIFFVTCSTAEMVSFLPISSPFIRLAGICCDEALEFMCGCNFWILEGALIPFEIVGVNSIIHYWRNDYSPAITICIQLVLYFLINLVNVAVYGEVEFWLSIGKVILALGLMLFTFITMVGGNPQHDVYGFRNWTEPAPMLEYISAGNLGRFQGLLACIIQASFTIAGPDYVSTVAGEAINPRKNLPIAYKQVFYRLTFIFIVGALCVGIVCSPRDPNLLAALENGSPGAGSSPYIIAMDNLGIKVLPHIVNGALALAAFSAGNSYTYCASRTLYGLALSGKAARFLTKCTKSGIPIYSVLISLSWGFLSFLQLGDQSQVVLSWIVNLITSCQLLNYAIMCTTYVAFYYACKSKNINRSDLPFRGWFQPWLGIIGGVCTFAMIFIAPYTLYFPSGEYWSLETFLFSFLLMFVACVLFIGYKVIYRTKWKKSSMVDWEAELQEVEAYEEEYL